MLGYLLWRARAQEPSGRLADVLLHSNTIFEAFGNATTEANTNSSRFGKHLALHFQSGAIASAVVSTYLLEATRAVQHAPGERSFHIFYQLLAGAEQSEREKLGLVAASPSACDFLLPEAVSDLDDAAEYGTTRSTMDYFAIEPELLGLVGALLHLGSVQFEPRDDGASAVRDAAPFAPINRLLGVEEISPLLLQRRLRLPGAALTLELTAQQSTAARDSFARACYERLFKWLVRAINLALAEAAVARHDPSLASIGLVELPGFEVCAANGFEQLCFNCADEKARQFFLAHVFKAEAALYAAEGVPAAHAFADNQGCVDLLEAPPNGILRLLDSHGAMPHASDASFCERVRAAHGHSPYLAPPHAESGGESTFTVRHFAGEVKYSAHGFLRKNSSALDAAFRAAMLESSVPFLRDLFALDADESTQPQRAVRAEGSGEAASSSAAKRFLSETAQLFTQLGSGGAHFVHCMRPNGRSEHGQVDSAMLLRQLRANGALEAVRLVRDGFPIRVPYELLASRYLGLLSAKAPAVEELTPLQFCELIVALVGMRPQHFMCGASRLFLRGDAGALFDQLREKEPDDVLRALQTKTGEWMRKERSIEVLRPWLAVWSARRRFLRWRAAACRVQARHRGNVDRQRARARMLEAAPGRERLREEERALWRAEDEQQAQQGGERKQRAGGFVLRLPSSSRGLAKTEEGFEVEAMPPLSLPVQHELRRALAATDYNRMELEARALVAKLVRKPEARDGDFGREQGSSTKLKSEDMAGGSAREPAKWAILRPSSGMDGSGDQLELVVVQDGRALPLFSQALSSVEVEKARAAFAKWDIDKVEPVARDRRLACSFLALCATAHLSRHLRAALMPPETAAVAQRI